MLLYVVLQASSNYCQNASAVSASLLPGDVPCDDGGGRLTFSELSSFILHTRSCLKCLYIEVLVSSHHYYTYFVDLLYYNVKKLIDSDI